MNRLLALLLTGVLCAVAFAQGPERPSVAFADFGGGLNTNDNRYFVQDNQFFQLKNIVIDRPLGTASIRPAWVPVIDSLGNIYQRHTLHSHRFQDGKGYLFSTTQTYTGATKTSYALLSHSNAFAYDPFNIIDTVCATEGRWLTWLDYEFYFDGCSGGKIINRSGNTFTSRPIATPAPGQLEIMPLDTSTGTLTGEFLWAWQFEIPCSTGGTPPYWNEVSILSRPTQMLNQVAKLPGFIRMAKDSGCSPRPTSYQVRILRTRGDRISFGSDSIFFIDSFTLTESNLPDVQYLDNKPIVTANFYKTLDSTQMGFPGSPWKRDSTYTWSAPGRMGWDVTNATSSDSILFSQTDDVLVYTYYFLDSLTGTPSDTAPILQIQGIFTSPYWQIQNINLTIPPSPDGRYWRVLLRTSAVSNFHLRPGLLLPFTILDTLRQKDDTTYQDVLTDSALNIRGNFVWQRKVIEATPEGGVVHDARLAIFDKNRVYFSVADSAGKYGAFENLEFDLDDGDRIIGLSSFDDYLVVYKTRSTWIVYTQDGVIYDREKKSVGWGMASFNSLSSYAGNNIFLSPGGVLFEGANPTLERSLVRNYISDPIRNILLKDLDDMLRTYGKVFEDRYYFSHAQTLDAGEDTTFVWFFKTQGWTMYDFAMRQMILYDTLNRTAFSPFNELVFLGEDLGQRIFRLTKSDSLDDINEGIYSTKEITAIIEKRHLGLTEPGVKFMDWLQITKEANTDDTSTIEISIHSEAGDSIGGATFDTLNSYYDFRYVLPTGNRIATAFRLRLTAKSHTNFKLHALFAKWTNGGMSIRR